VRLGCKLRINSEIVAFQAVGAMISLITKTGTIAGQRLIGLDGDAAVVSA
jgi:hypothetical protein